MNLPATLAKLVKAAAEPAPMLTLYPSSDGKPMSNNARHLHWIILIYCNLAALFRGRKDVAVHADLMWYAEEGDPKEGQAPDVMVVLGRPPAERDSYKQWEEDGIPATVAFEILSPTNSGEEMLAKHEFYEAHGVEEYYVYNPETDHLRGWSRQGTAWLRITPMDGWDSPRLGICFDLSGERLILRDPAGNPFLTFEELQQQWQEAEQRADKEKQRAEQAEGRSRRLKELGRKARLGQASPEELAELEQIESEIT